MSDISVRRDRSWTFNALRNIAVDEDWPESRPVPYSRVDRHYRPQRVMVAFDKRNDEPVKLGNLTIYGPRIIKAGAKGAVVDERMYYGPPRSDPEPWLAAIIRACCVEIDNDLNGTEAK